MKPVVFPASPAVAAFGRESATGFLLAPGLVAALQKVIDRLALRAPQDFGFALVKRVWCPQQVGFQAKPIAGIATPPPNPTVDRDGGNIALVFTIVHRHRPSPPSYAA
jgi:hypothetical protein